MENLPFPLVIASICLKGNDGADFGCIWIQSNGVIAHVEIKGCCKGEVFKLCSTVLILGVEKGFIINLLLTSQKSLRKHGGSLLVF